MSKTAAKCVILSNHWHCEQDCRMFGSACPAVIARGLPVGCVVTSMEQGPVISTLVRTLLSVGFRITDTHHKPSYIGLSAARRDEFGVENRYLFACVAVDRELAEDDVHSLKKVAQHDGTALVIVGRVSPTPSDVAVMSDKELFGRRCVSIKMRHTA